MTLSPRELKLVMEEREACVRIITENMLCDGDDGVEVLMPRSNPGNDVGLAYADAIRSRPRPSAPEKGGAWKCDGCGRTTDDPEADLRALRASGAIACCPERKMLPITPPPALGELIGRLEAVYTAWNNPPSPELPDGAEVVLEAATALRSLSEENERLCNGHGRAMLSISSAIGSLLGIEGERARFAEQELRTAVSELRVRAQVKEGG